MRPLAQADGIGKATTRVMQTTPHGRHGAAGHARDFLPAQALELVEDEHQAFTIAQAIERGLDALSRSAFTQLETSDRLLAAEPALQCAGDRAPATHVAR